MFEKIKTIIVEHLSVEDPSKLTMETSFDAIDIDSIDAVEIIMAIEDEFEIEIPDDLAKNFNSIQDIMRTLETILA